MKTLIKLILIGSALLFAATGFAQTDVDDVAEVRDVNEELKLAAVEACVEVLDQSPNFAVASGTLRHELRVVPVDAVAWCAELHNFPAHNMVNPFSRLA